ncbi:MAG: hypothetical protein IJ141_08340 [Lachnospiraceae bacterium]|nr:hypothetical protein [Lachnospiraceae bacterium]
MFLRDELSFKAKQEEHMKDLLEEISTGVIEMDILPNTAQPLQGEVEAMYFNEINRFFENSISRRIMTRNQDLYEGE